MSTTAARLVALPFLLLAFGLRLAYEFWIVPLTWRIDNGWAAFAVWVVSFTATAAIPVCAYLLLTRRARRRPATWQLDQDERRFAAMTTPGVIGPAAVAMGFVAGGLPVFERVPGEDRRRIAEFDAVATVSITTVIIVLALITVLVLLDRPRIALDPEAITLQRVRDRLRIPWAELVPGGPSRRGRRPYPGTFTLYRVKAGAPVPLVVPAHRLHVDSAFLAHTIQYYTGYPGRRSEIGTEAGLTELRSSFQAAQGGPAESSTS